MRTFRRRRLRLVRDCKVRPVSRPSIGTVAGSATGSSEVAERANVPAAETPPHSRLQDRSRLPAIRGTVAGSATGSSKRSGTCERSDNGESASFAIARPGPVSGHPLEPSPVPLRGSSIRNIPQAPSGLPPRTPRRRAKRSRPVEGGGAIAFPVVNSRRLIPWNAASTTRRADRRGCSASRR